MGKTYKVNGINVSRYKEFAIDDKGRICLVTSKTRKAAKDSGFVGFYSIEELARQFARADFHGRTIARFGSDGKTIEEIVSHDDSVHVEFRGDFRYEALDFFHGLRKVDGGYLFEQFVLTEDKLEDWKPKPSGRKRQEQTEGKKKPSSRRKVKAA